MKNLLILLLLFSVLSASAGMDCELDSKVQHFFGQLEGGWNGEAVTTPVGPRPYDIDFEHREMFWIYGQADPGAAIHHWGFYCDKGELWLRFLSTFRGNRSPTLLKAKTITDSEIHFKAIDPDFLEVKIRPSEKQSQFEVLHHGERHVLIELQRAKDN